MTPEEMNQQLDLLRQDLENTKQSKNHEIIELKHALSRAEIHIKTLQDKCQFLSAEHQALKQRYKELELYTNERAHSMMQKNLKISQLEEKVEIVAKEKEKEMQDQINKLIEVVRTQEEELSIYLADHQNYVEQFEKMALAFKDLQTERNLLNEYNAELEKQINEVEKRNLNLQNWISDAYGQLKCQNQQSGDMLNQIEYMMSTLEQQTQ